ncbi:MAG: NUMOD4 domain-containing protein, partial [Nanoarchaeota archaeon]
VAKMFIPNTDNNIFVLHKNGNKLDNRVENLKWGGKERIAFNIIEGEEWREITGFEGLYDISNFGIVYSRRRHNKSSSRGDFQTGRIFYQINNNGYKHVKLLKDGISKTCKVHRLVAFAFIPNDRSNSAIPSRI